MRVLAISGSLQAHSGNRMLVETARAIAPPGTSVTIYDGLRTVPAFDPDLDADGTGDGTGVGGGPEPVEALRELLRAADGVLIATPEYAHAMPGALKNALDWMVGSGDLYGKPVAVVSAAPSEARGHHARGDLERTLRAQGADVRRSTTIAVAPSERDGPAGERTAALVAEVLAALGDPA